MPKGIPKSKAGRKDVMTEEMLHKLEEAFKNALTDDEACLDVGVSTSRFYEYCAENPKWRERTKVLKRTPNIQAKKNWKKEIDGGNYTSSKEWLERKAKDEFSTKQEIQQDLKVDGGLDISTKAGY